MNIFILIELFLLAVLFDYGHVQRMVDLSEEKPKKKAKDKKTEAGKDKGTEEEKNKVEETGDVDKAIEEFHSLKESVPVESSKDGNDDEIRIVERDSKKAKTSSQIVSYKDIGMPELDKPKSRALQIRAAKNREKLILGNSSLIKPD